MALTDVVDNFDPSIFENLKQEFDLLNDTHRKQTRKELEEKIYFPLYKTNAKRKKEIDLIVIGYSHVISFDYYFFQTQPKLIHDNNCLAKSFFATFNENDIICREGGSPQKLCKKEPLGDRHEYFQLYLRHILENDPAILEENHSLFETFTPKESFNIAIDIWIDEKVGTFLEKLAYIRKLDHSSPSDNILDVVFKQVLLYSIFKREVEQIFPECQEKMEKCSSYYGLTELIAENYIFPLDKSRETNMAFNLNELLKIKKDSQKIYFPVGGGHIKNSYLTKQIHKICKQQNKKYVIFLSKSN